jgi:hypothetical protein
MLWSLALVPAAWVVLFATLVLRARLALGYWPGPYRPDPKDLDFGVHYLATLAGIPLMFAAVFSVLVLAAISFRRAKVRPGRLIIPVFVGLASLASVVALAQIDPLRLFTWLGD